MKITRYQNVSVLLLLLCCAFSENQKGAENTEPLKVSLCDLYKEPQRYAGKTVRVRASITSHRQPELQDFSSQTPCSNYFDILLVLPADVKPKPDFNLEADEAFKKYQEALHQPTRIEATLEGRFDSVLSMQDGRRVRLSEPYGKKHTADGRLVLHKMSDVTTWYIPRR